MATNVTIIPTTYPKKKVYGTSYLNSPANASDRRTFSTATKCGNTLQISFYDFDPFPIVTSAKLIMDMGTAHPKSRSITRLMRRNVSLRAKVENEVVAYLELRNESLLADAYSESFSTVEIN